eukprot:12820658-Alexandrium_andersonii.AAC.1
MVRSANGHESSKPCCISDRACGAHAWAGVDAANPEPPPGALAGHLPGRSHQREARGAEQHAQ